ncbi:metallochaperone AztD [Rubrimonas cliftonensis]|uniref:YncE family protein n=1 Tax=Rubrimonas cliftonensis TaxID=89524 RepID=A0A1H4GH48_9RHOB|nr:metallochaperone AztD [Rubrimonas cliftonensis]SEB08198.1 hypothetical protein SAMN05444370_1624 [Rubrimonas cliftonensis]
MNTIARLLVATLVAGPVAAQDHDEVWRLFVADHADPVVRAVDLEHAKVIEAFTLSAPAALRLSSSGRLVYAAQRDGGAVAVIDTGVAREEHGDHDDVTLTAPRLLEARIEGAKPVHVVEHDGRTAVFFDDEGVVRIVTEAALLAGDPTATEVATAAPHHGVAVTMGAHLIVSVPHPEDPTKLPIGVEVRDAGGAVVGELHACPDLHGEASAGSAVVIACATGVLRIEPGDAGPAVVFVPYPAGMPEGKTTTLIGNDTVRWFVGNWGRDGLVSIDAWEGAFDHARLPVRRVHFAADPERPRFAYVFTEDGALHRFDVLNAEIVASLPLTEPYSMDGHWSDPRPRIAVAGDAIVVSDPLKGVLRVVDAESFVETATIAVPGKPFALVAVGGAPHGH